MSSSRLLIIPSVPSGEEIHMKYNGFSISPPFHIELDVETNKEADKPCCAFLKDNKGYIVEKFEPSLEGLIKEEAEFEVMTNARQLLNELDKRYKIALSTIVNSNQDLEPETTSTDAAPKQGGPALVEIAMLIALLMIVLKVAVVVCTMIEKSY